MTTKTKSASDPVTLIYQACDPTEALEPGDRRYVPLAAARGDEFAEQGGWRRQITRAIYRSNAPASCLVSGFLGDGKSTELKRLAQELRDGTTGPKFATIYVDCEKYINPDAYSFADILVAIIGETGKQLKVEYGINLNPSYLRTRIDEIYNLLTSNVAMESADVKAKLEPLEIALKLSLKTKVEATTRRELWAALEGENSDLAERFGELLRAEVRPALRERGYHDIVVVVDYLEKLICLKTTTEGTPNSHVDLFIHHAPHFLKLGTHLVLTVPIDLVYSADQERLTSAYGREPQAISAVRVISHFADNDRRIALDAMVELIRRRCERLGDGSVAFDAVFPDKLLAEELVEFPGGHPRQLLILIRQCLQFIEELPITREAFVAAKKKEVEAASRKVPERWFAKLAAVHATHRIDNDAEHLEMLRTLCIFAYSNSEPVYSVDPAILELTRMKEAIGAHAKTS
ncbi:MAG: hypothetical protein ABI779_24305 [Acidobacteriota bacterium]